jgi:hypothetical protein
MEMPYVISAHPPLGITQIRLLRRAIGNHLSGQALAVSGP